MKKVLLAIDGISPSRQAFHYAVALCKRIKGELSMFQIIRPQHFQTYKKKVHIVREFIEGSMTAVTFAEAGEHEVALDVATEVSEYIKHFTQKSEEEGVHCDFTIKTGVPEKEISKYVSSNGNIVLTIYDASDADTDKMAHISREKRTLGKLKKDLSVPLVTVQN